MSTNLRNEFYAGLLVSIALGIYLFQLWRPARQVELHSENLLRAIEDKDWAAFADFVGEGYEDQWGHNRAVVLARVQQVVVYTRGLEFQTHDAVVRRAETDEPFWRARITVSGEENELMTLIERPVNAVTEPWELHWRRQSWKPWGWKLVRVSNPGFQLPEGSFY